MTGHLRAEELAPNGLFVKICGITNEEDALLCVALGADALGFIFAAGSKRQVAPTVVADIVKRLPPEVITRWTDALQKISQDTDWLRGNESIAGNSKKSTSPAISAEAAV